MVLLMPYLEFPVALIPGGIGYSELFFLFCLILVLFGPSRLPAIARKMGQWFEQLRTAAQVFHNNLLSMDDDFESSESSESKDTAAESKEDHGPSH